MEMGTFPRRFMVTLVLAASIVVYGVVWGDDRSPRRSPSARPPRDSHRRPVTLNFRNPAFRPEFDPAAVARGEADEPTISTMDADWSHGIELRATVDRTQYRQLQRIHVVTWEKAVSDRRWYAGVPCHFSFDRYLSRRVRVFDADGKLVPMTEWCKHEGLRASIIDGMGPGVSGHRGPKSSSHIDVIPNLIYDMTCPGDYWILIEEELRQLDPPPPKGEEFFYVRAKPIKVTVIPELASIFLDGTIGSSVTDPDRP